MNKVKLVGRKYKWDDNMFQRNFQEPIDMNRFKNILNYIIWSQVNAVPTPVLKVQPLQSWRIDEECIYSSNEFFFLNYIINNIGDGVVSIDERLVCDIGALCVSDKLFLVGIEELGNFFTSVEVDEILSENVQEMLKSCLSHEKLPDGVLLSKDLGCDVYYNPVKLLCIIENNCRYISITSKLINFPMSAHTLRSIISLATTYKTIKGSKK